MRWMKQKYRSSLKKENAWERIWEECSQKSLNWRMWVGQLENSLTASVEVTVVIWGMNGGIKFIHWRITKCGLKEK